MCQLTTLTDHFASLEDPRVARTRAHALLDLLVIAVCATLCGAEGFVAIATWARAKEAWLRARLPLTGGIPSHDTFTRVFARLDPDAFRDCFLAWVQALHTASAGEVLALDGKTLRHSFDRAARQSPIHMVSAFAVDHGLVLGQVKVEEKSNEITAIPALLALLDLKGCIVTIDAMGCQKSIAGQIVAQEGDYVLGLKENHPTLHTEVEEYFADARENGFGSVEPGYDRTFDGDHGRTETRECWTVEVADLDWLSGTRAWKGLRTLGMVEARRRLGTQVSVERRYFLSSLPGTGAANAARFAQAVRSHWAIENQVHWVLDVVFNEDASRIRKGHAPQNVAMLRHLALNLLRQERTSKLSLKLKRQKAGWDSAYLDRLLSAEI